MLEKYIITLDYTVKNAIEQMVAENIKAVVVVDENRKVLGLFTNGDMRQFFLKGGELSENIQLAMNHEPVLYHGYDEVFEERKRIKRVIYPIVNQNNILERVIDDDNDKGYQSEELANVPLVIMAGGKGTRLYPYTKILPKALIPIGDITITERIINSFKKFGCREVFMILNHKSEMIKSYMNEIEKDYSVNFYKEKEFLGTAGGLLLLKEQIKSTFYLSNCDIIINDDLACAYKTYKMKKNAITFICSMKDIIIPYGVVQTDENGNILSMKEKPNYSQLVNTGVYVVEPYVINLIRENELIHMPELAKRCIDRGYKVGVFPIPESSWMDMGQFDEMKNMLQKIEND